MTKFPIDAVYTWVDGSDPHFIKTKEIYGIKHQPTRAAFDHGEIRESINSLKRYAPWIRTIFVVTWDGQKPALAWDNKLKHITHKTIFGDEFEAHLPVFNSHAIECHIHRIPCLAEHFIYFNDDTFVGADVSPGDFFHHDGRPKVFLGRSTVKHARYPRTFSYAHLHARSNNLKILQSIFNDKLQCKKSIIHQAVPLRRQIYEDCWNHPRIRASLVRTSSSRIRDARDLWIVGLASLWGLQTGQCGISYISARYVAIADIGPLNLWFKLLQKTQPKLYCINDIMVFASRKRVRALQHLLKTALPHHGNAGAHERATALSLLCRYGSLTSFVLFRVLGFLEKCRRYFMQRRMSTRQLFSKRYVANRRSARDGKYSGVARAGAVEKGEEI